MRANHSRFKTRTCNDDLAGHQQHGRANYVRSDIADAELLESATLFDTIRLGSYTITNNYKPPPTVWTNAALPAHQHPAICVDTSIATTGTTQRGVTSARTVTATG